MHPLLLAAALYVTPPGLSIAEQTSVIVRANVTTTDLTQDKPRVTREYGASICSGFVAYSKGTQEIIITARHCTLPDTETFMDQPVAKIDLEPTTVQFFDGDVGEVERVYDAPNDDVAILQVRSSRPHPYAFLDPQVHRAESAFAFGMPHRMYWSYSSAIVMQGDVYDNAESPWKDTFLIDCPSCGEGSSGGPVFGFDGRVIGIVVAGDGTHTIMVPTDRILPLLRAQ